MESSSVWYLLLSRHRQNLHLLLRRLGKSLSQTTATLLNKILWFFSYLFVLNYLILYKKHINYSSEMCKFIEKTINVNFFPLKFE